MKQSNWLIIIIIFIFFIIVLGVLEEKKNGSVTVYSRSCEQSNLSAKDCKSWNVGKEVFYVNKATQQVFF